MHNEMSGVIVGSARARLEKLSLTLLAAMAANPELTKLSISDDKLVKQSIDLAKELMLQVDTATEEDLKAMGRKKKSETS